MAHDGGRRREKSKLRSAAQPLSSGHDSCLLGLLLQGPKRIGAWGSYSEKRMMWRGRLYTFGWPQALQLPSKQESRCCNRNSVEALPGLCQSLYLPEAVRPRGRRFAWRCVSQQGVARSVVRSLAQLPVGIFLKDNDTPLSPCRLRAILPVATP